MIQQQINNDNGEEDIFETLNANEDDFIQHALLESLTQQTSPKPSTSENHQNVVDDTSTVNKNENGAGNANTNSETNANINENTNTNTDTNTDTNTNIDANTNTGTATITHKDDNGNEKKITNENYDRLDNDYLIALALQQDEANQQKKVLSKMYSNRKHNKVNTTYDDKMNVHFYYDYDNSDYNNIENEDSNLNNNNLIDDETVNFGPSHVVTSRTSLKHDSTVWNKKHIERLNEYDIFGNLNENEVHLNSQSYNSLRNALEKKGFKKFEGPMIESRKRRL